jgi:hypothetical protein
MAWKRIIWDPTVGGNVQHIEEHDLTAEDVEHVLMNHESRGCSRASGRPCLFGHTVDGRYIVIVYEEIDEDTVVPVTACEVPEPGNEGSP